jgi:hypothetical protein
MAANILAVLNSHRATIAEEARANALQFSWDSSMDALFGTLYPAAFAARAAERLEASAEPALAA